MNKTVKVNCCFKKNRSVEFSHIVSSEAPMQIAMIDDIYVLHKIYLEQHQVLELMRFCRDNFSQLIYGNPSPDDRLKLQSDLDAANQRIQQLIFELENPHIAQREIAHSTNNLDDTDW